MALNLPRIFDVGQTTLYDIHYTLAVHQCIWCFSPTLAEREHRAQVVKGLLVGCDDSASETCAADILDLYQAGVEAEYPYPSTFMAADSECRDRDWLLGRTPRGAQTSRTKTTESTVDTPNPLV